jgi:nucleoside phosphorylase
MSLVYVFAASKMEAQPVADLAPPGQAPHPVDGGVTFTCAANTLTLTVSGMGPKKAISAAQAALNGDDGRAEVGASKAAKPEAILVVGLCGGLTESLSEGRIVAYTNCLSTDPTKPPIVSNPQITSRIIQILASTNIACDQVAGLTSPQIATNREHRVRLAQFGAAVVDMETYAVLAAAARAGVPAAVLRVVSDSLDRELPDLNRAINEDGALDGRKALGVAIRSPLRTLRLLAANKRAMQKLSAALQIVLPSDCFSHPG